MKLNRPDLEHLQRSALDKVASDMAPEEAFAALTGEQCIIPKHPHHGTLVITSAKSDEKRIIDKACLLCAARVLPDAQKPLVSSLVHQLSLGAVVAPHLPGVFKAMRRARSAIQMLVPTRPIIFRSYTDEGNRVRILYGGYSPEKGPPTLLQHWRLYDSAGEDSGRPPLEERTFIYDRDFIHSGHLRDATLPPYWGFMVMSVMLWASSVVTGKTKAFPPYYIRVGAQMTQQLLDSVGSANKDMSPDGEHYVAEAAPALAGYGMHVNFEGLGMLSWRAGWHSVWASLDTAQTSKYRDGKYPMRLLTGLLRWIAAQYMEGEDQTTLPKLVMAQLGRDGKYHLEDL